MMSADWVRKLRDGYEAEARRAAAEHDYAEWQHFCGRIVALDTVLLEELPHAYERVPFPHSYGNK
jgi:hypothetical protein